MRPLLIQLHAIVIENQMPVIFALKFVNDGLRRYHSRFLLHLSVKLCYVVGHYLCVVGLVYFLASVLEPS